MTTISNNSGSVLAAHSRPIGLLSTEQACRWLGVSKSWLDKARVSGDGPRFCRVGRLVRYRVSDLDDYLDTTSRQSTSERSMESSTPGRRN